MSKCRLIPGASLLALLAMSGGLVSCSSNGTNSDQSQSASSSSPASPGGAASKPRATTIAIPENTPLSITVDQTLTSSQTRTGDTFEASVATPLVIDSRTVVPRGAKVKGYVAEATPSGRLQNPGTLVVALKSIEIEGKSYDLSTDTVSRKGDSHKTRNAEMIGGGAAAGAIIGAIAGHGKGAAIGAAAGAGAGTAGAAATGKKDVSIPAETQLTFHLKQSLSVTLKG